MQIYDQDLLQIKFIILNIYLHFTSIDAFLYEPMCSMNTHADANLLQIEFIILNFNSCYI